MPSSRSSWQSRSEHGARAGVAFARRCHERTVECCEPRWGWLGASLSIKSVHRPQCPLLRSNGRLHPPLNSLSSSKNLSKCSKYFFCTLSLCDATMKRDRKGKVVRKRKRRKKKRSWHPSSSHYSRGGDFLSTLVTVQEDKGDPFVNHRAKQAASSSPAASSSAFIPKRSAAKLDSIEE